MEGASSPFFGVSMMGLSVVEEETRAKVRAALGAMAKGVMVRNVDEASLVVNIFPLLLLLLLLFLLLLW